MTLRHLPVQRTRVSLILATLITLTLLPLAGCVWHKKPATSLDRIAASLPKASATGQVVDEAGKPVTNADVFLYYARGKDGFRNRLAGKTKSNASGAFRFNKSIVWEPIIETRQDQGMEPRYVVIARAPSNAIDYAILLKEDPTDNVKITVHKPNMMKVPVVDDKGKPVAGAKVYLRGGEHVAALSSTLPSSRRYFNILQDIGLSSGVTDEKGIVELPAFPTESWFRAVKEGYAVGDHTPNPLVPATILFPAAHIAGKATYPDGKPAPNAVVWLEYQGKSLGWSASTVTDAQGKYAFENVPATGFRYSWQKPEEEAGAEGKISIIAEDMKQGSPFVCAKVELPIKPGDRLTQDLAFAKACIFEARIIDITTSRPVPEIGLSRFINNRDWLEVKADQNGVLRMAVPPGSQMSLQFSTTRPHDYIIDEGWQQQGHYQAFEGKVDKNITDRDIQVKLWPTQPLTGKVVDPKGQPVSNASVYIKSGVREARTDTSGTYVLKTAPTDRPFNLLAISADKKMGAFLRMKEWSTSATLGLQPTVEMEGFVKTPEGTPAPDLKFNLDVYANKSDLAPVRDELQTDAKGYFVAKHVIPGAIHFAWWMPDGETNRDYDHGNAEIDLTKLAPGTPIRFEAKRYINALLGRVVDDKKEPVPGADIQLGSSSWNMMPQDARNMQMKSDPKGNFSFERLAGGNITLTFTAPGYKTQTVTTPTDKVDLAVVMKKSTGKSIYNVTVTDEAKKPMAGVPLGLHIMEVAAAGKVTTRTLPATTDAKGKAVIRYDKPDSVNVAQGAVVCDFAPYDIAAEGITIDQDSDIAFTLKKSPEYWTGQVNSAGKPVVGARIRVFGISIPERQFASLLPMDKTSFATDSNGNFTLNRFGKEKGVSLEIAAPGLALSNSFFDPRSPETKTFELSPAGAIKGKVIVKATGKGLANARLYAQPETFTSGMRGGSGVASEDGAFSIDNLKPGNYKVMCMMDEKHRNYVCMTPPTPAEVKEGQAAEVLFAVEEGIPVRGKIIDATTRTTPKGTIMVGGTNPKTMMGNYGKVNGDGTWVLYLPEGNFDLMYSIPEARTQGTDKTINIKKGNVYNDLVIEIKPTPAK